VQVICLIYNSVTVSVTVYQHIADLFLLLRSIYSQGLYSLREEIFVYAHIDVSYLLPDFVEAPYI